MKLIRKKSVLVILISIFFIYFISVIFFRNVENGKEKSATQSQEILDDESPLLFYKEKYKTRYADLWRATPLYPKEVYLTFDDGPSVNNTPAIIDILNHNNVKATFFVIGQSVETYPEIIKKMYTSGMCIAPHTYSHNYRNIYRSTEAYLKDMEKCNNAIKAITNQSDFSYLRMPGGSDNLISNAETLKKIKLYIKKRNINYVDWNISSEDALGHNIKELKIKQNIMSQSTGESMAVVLMHDSYYKETTVNSLKGIISYFKKEGYTFRTFNDISEEEKQKMIKKGVLNR